MEEDQVKESLSKLDIRESKDFDEVPCMLRKIIDVIVRPLSVIFELSWRLEEVPEEWMKASTTPVFKKGKKEDSGTYRPVSLTLIPGKVIEQLIRETIYRHMKDRKLIRSSQHKEEVILDQPDNLL